MSKTHNTEKLENCPFCGAKARYFMWQEQLGVFCHFIRCSYPFCKATQPAENTKTRAFAKWNRRATKGETPYDR